MVALKLLDHKYFHYLVTNVNYLLGLELIFPLMFPISCTKINIRLLITRETSMFPQRHYLLYVVTEVYNFKVNKIGRN